MSQDLLGEIVRRVRSGAPLAVCRLVETRGSTPQKAGAEMLVFPSGEQAGTLGGGCVEAEVKRRALATLSGGAARLSTFHLDNDYGWDDGLICGGRMTVLIDPVLAPDQALYYERLQEVVALGRGAVEAIAFDDKAPVPAPTCLLFDATGRHVAAGPGAPELSADQIEAVRLRLQPLSARPRSWAADGLAFLPRLPRCRLVIVGGGHVGQSVGALAPDLDFDVTVVDDRDGFVSLERFPRAVQRLAGPIDDLLPALEITSDTYCLVVTRGHNHDEQALFHLLGRGARYLGMIGSKRKIKLIFDDLLAQGVKPADLAAVHAPLGVEIGSQTVPEIALSILAELVAHRNQGGRIPGRAAPNAILAAAEPAATTAPTASRAPIAACGD